MISYILNLAGLLFFIPVINHWINEYMYLKVILEVHGMAFVGILLGIKLQKKFRSLSVTEEAGESFLRMINPLGITSIIFLIGSLIFWMIPRSIDLMVSNDAINYAMLVNIYSAGIFFGGSLAMMPFALKTATAIYGLSMMLTLGVIDMSIRGLLCAVYNIEMQKMTGEYILKLFPFLFALFLYRAYKNLSKIEQENNSQITGLESRITLGEKI